MTDWEPTHFTTEDCFKICGLRRITQTGNNFAVAILLPASVKREAHWPEIEAAAKAWLTNELESKNREKWRRQELQRIPVVDFDTIPSLRFLAYSPSEAWMDAHP